jgi:DNA repair photolyase
MQAITQFNHRRDTQINSSNLVLKNEYGDFEKEGVDDFEVQNKWTECISARTKKIVNKVSSPDITFTHSLTPYQGCKQTCVYSFARNAHKNCGFNASQDFEQKIIVKRNAAQKLEELFLSKKWKCIPIVLSEKTGCDLPAERKYKITRSILENCLRYQNPIVIITKNKLILRDLDLLKKLSEKNLVQVFVSITGINEKIRRKLEPRTVNYSTRFDMIESLSKVGVPVGVMNAPIIPGVNDREMYEVLRQASLRGATAASFKTLRLNDDVAPPFKDWIKKSFPLKVDKILNLISACHNGKLNHSNFSSPMKGSVNIAYLIKQRFDKYTSQFKLSQEKFEFNTQEFIRHQPGQMRLF